MSKSNDVRFYQWWNLSFNDDFVARYLQTLENMKCSSSLYWWCENSLKDKDWPSKRIITVNLNSIETDFPICSFALDSCIPPLYPVKGVKLLQTEGEFSLFRTNELESGVELPDDAWWCINKLMKETKTDFYDIAILAFDAEKEFDMKMYHHLSNGEKNLIFSEMY